MHKTIVLYSQILLVFSCLVPNSGHEAFAQETISETDEINKRWDIKLVKKELEGNYLGHGVNYIYTNSVGGKFTSMMIFDKKEGRLLRSSFRIPLHSSVTIVTPLMLSQPDLMGKLFNFGVEIPKDHADLPLNCHSTISLNEAEFRTVGFKKPTGVGMSDLIFGDGGYRLKLVDGNSYAPVSYEESELSDVSLENLLEKKHKVRRLTVNEGEEIDSRQHRRDGSLVFEEKTIRHPKRGIHKHYTFYNSADPQEIILQWSIQKDGEFAYLEKAATSNLLFADNQSDGHYEWMVFPFGESEELIDTSDPWHIKLAGEKKYLAFLDCGKAVGVAMGELSKQYMKAKDGLQSK